MTRSWSAIVWISLGVGSGVLGSSQRSPAAWMPAVGVIAASLQLGFPGVAGVGASVLSGWAVLESAAGCPAELQPLPPRVQGFVTGVAANRGGSVEVRLTQLGSKPSPRCMSPVSVYRHGGDMTPGVVVDVFGSEQPDRRARRAFVADSLQRSPTLRWGRPRMDAALVRIRTGLDRRIERTVGHTAAPLALALVSGRRGDVARSVRAEFSRSGTAHLLAISGFHVGVIGGLFALTAAMFGAGPRARGAAAALLVWGYVLMIGSPASGVRAAGLMTAVGVGRTLGRPTRRLPALAAVFLTCVVLRPDLLGGIGFQLSFAASVGLVATASWPDRCWQTITSVLSRLTSSGVFSGMPRALTRCAEGLVRGTVVALGATLPTIPLVAWHFGAVSLVSVPATLVAMPLAAAGIVAVLASVIADLASPALGVSLGAGAAWILALFELTVRAFAQIPFAAVPVSGPAAATLGATGLALAIILRGATVRIAAAAAAMIWVSAGSLVESVGRLSGQGTVEIVFIDVGQGDATLIRSPSNRWTLVDAGPASATWDAGAERVAPVLERLGVRELETLVLTHADADHVGGAATVLSRFEVGTVVDPGTARGTDPFVAALEAAVRRDVPWRAVRAGQRWEVDGVSFEVLSPDATVGTVSTNEGSVVILVRYGRFEALLTGDASVAIERGVLSDLPDSLEVLKVGHHGSETSTAAALLAHSAPELAVISVGAANRYGHPAPSVLTRLERHGARILRTDRHGTVRVVGSPDGAFRVSTTR